MDAISTLLDRNPTFVGPKAQGPKVETLCAPITSKGTARPVTYEDEVFNYLLGNKDALGIDSVCKFKNLLLDGQIVLSDHRRFVIEIKLRMNWMKACQAEWQFRQFLKRAKHPDTPPISGGIVFFDSFTSDWARPVGGIIRGWKHWYAEHSKIDGLRVHLIRLSGQNLAGYPQQSSASPVGDALQR